MNVLSLFDGMSCGRIALDRLGIKVDNYYASEIDKYAMQVSKANYPDIIQIGDILHWKSWDIDWRNIGFVSGGFPCQSWSLAGKQLGDKDERGKMFWVMLEIMQKVMKSNPNAYYLMENVRMKKEFEEYITTHTENALPNVNKYCINSALLSAQNRVRYYWTNISGIEQPEQRGIVLRDILETETINLEKTQQKPVKVGMNVEQVKIRKHEVDIISLQYLLREMKKESGKTNKQIAEETNTPITKVEHWFRTDSSFAIPSDDIWLKLKEVLGFTSSVFDKQIMEFEYRDGVFESTQRVYSDQGKSPTLTASNKEQMIETKPKQVGVAVDVNGYDCLKRVYSPDGKSPTVTTCQGGNTEPKVVKGGAFRARSVDKDGNRVDWKDTKPQQMLELRKDQKSNTVSSVAKDSVVVDQELTWRKLTPLECMRLQTVQDDYLMPVSNSQKYKLLGNGWTIEVICHILKKIKEDI